MSNTVVVKDDYGYALTFSLFMSDNVTPVNLTGASVKFQAADYRDPSKIKINGSCVTATAGVCFYTVTVSDFDTAGQYVGKLIISFVATDKVVTARNINITCTDGLI